MKKTLLITSILFSQFALSQIWVNSLDEAKKLAKTTNKFILIDFNANWCKPCKEMEANYFHNPKYKESLDKFIAVSIDIDANKNIADYYNVSSIPNVKIVDIAGNVIHDVLGYNGAESSNKEFIGFPENSENLYESLAFADPKNPTVEELLTLGGAYQLLLQKSHSIARKKFATLSNTNFTKCAKKTKDNNIKEVAELGKFFNMALTDSGSKVIKNLDVNKISEQNKSYAYYVLAKSNYEEKQKEKGDELISEIEKINDPNWTSAAKTLKNKFSAK